MSDPLDQFTRKELLQKLDLSIVVDTYSEWYSSGIRITLKSGNDEVSEGTFSFPSESGSGW